MSTARAGMQGHAPTVLVTNKPPKKTYNISAEQVRKLLPEYTDEQKKYIKCWNLDDYRTVAPGEGLVDLFLETANPNKGMTVIDWGCGTGRASKRLYEEGPELDVTMCDFAFNCLDKDVKKLAKNNDRLRFVEKDLTKFTGLQSEFGFCTDVMEHIPTEDVDRVLSNILYASKHVFFQIATKNDIFSKHPDLDIEDDLHLTVQPYLWWLRKFAEHSVIVHHSNDMHGHVIFYVTGWSKTALTWEGGYVNTDIEIVKDNMTTNSKFGIQPVQPYGGDGETEVMLLCGGPTLNDFEEEIREHRENGVKCITVNGTYNWCIDKGISPSLQCMIDARPFMHRFVEQNPLTEETKFVISSQCDPSIFSGLPKERTYMWQVSISEELIPHIKECFGEMYKDWFPSPGGSTVGLRALVLLRMLGFNKIYVYGMDSCVFTDRNHHAYEQKENDHLTKEGTIPIVVGEGTRYEKTFQCQPWQAFQAREFELMTAPALVDTHLQFKGDGLISYLVEANAKMIEDNA